MKLVEVKTISKGPGGPVPDELSVDGETFSVRGITDRWFDARANYFKVVASNGIAYLLKADPKAGLLFEDADVPLGAYVLELFRPHCDAALAEVGCPQEVHVSPRLADAAADAQRYLVVENRLVIRQLEEVFLA
jgi:hypothetical protein